jgi:hypothetical protein
LEPVSGFRFALLIEGETAASVLVRPAAGLGEKLLMDWEVVELLKLKKGKSTISARKIPFSSRPPGAIDCPFEQAV